MSTNNFEKLVQQWLEAKDDWQDFFKNERVYLKQTNKLETIKTVNYNAKTVKLKKCLTKKNCFESSI